MAVNLAVTIGPALGGLLASFSYLYLFIGDAITSLITAGVVLMVLPETKPEASPEQAGQSMLQTIGGYGSVLRDSVYMAFLVASTLIVIVYMQMNSTLSVYLRDVHSVSTQGYGYILSLNARMVVLFQFWVTRHTHNRAPMIMMALGSLFYAIGFAMFGFVSSYEFFLLAMVIITIGEMIVSPVAQALVARLAPSDMRGRYMAIYGFTWMIPAAIGPLAAGIVLDNYNPDWVWYLCGMLGTLTVLVFLGLHSSTEKRLTKHSETRQASRAPTAHPAD